MRKILIPLSALIFTAVIAIGAPFKDIPTSHWAYDAIHKPAASGVFPKTPESESAAPSLISVAMPVQGAGKIGAGKGRYNDYDYTFFFSEIGSKF